MGNRSDTSTAADLSWTKLLAKNQPHFSFLDT
uniref:GSVIVT01015456001 n=1 Tax=Arundo donax TaxID=35708 RepID=A0A0A9EKY2_ARUDO